MVFDPSSSAESAYRLGRSGDVFAALDGQLPHANLARMSTPVIVFNQRMANQYLQKLAQKIDQPAVEASLHLEGTNVVAQAGQIGRTLNVNATLTYLGARLQTFTDGEVPLVIQETQPALTDVSSQADAARNLLSQPLQLVIPNAGKGDPGSWVYEPQTIANMLGVERGQNGNQSNMQVLLNPDSVRQCWQTSLHKRIVKRRIAQFHFNTTTNNWRLLLPRSQAAPLISMPASRRSMMR